MLIDAREIPAGKVIRTDLCIVGAGAAGLPMAREFAGSKTSVCLLEGGGFEFERESQALYQGQTDGTFLPKNGRYLVTSRQRLFGGTTHTWAGFTVPLDPIDFEERDWIPESGWPMTREDLDPFYLRAYPYCQCKPVETDLERYKGTDRPILDFGPGAGIVTKLIHLSTPPTNFAKVHGPPVLEASNITTYLHASAMELESNPAGTAVTGLKAGTLAGNRFRVEASAYVLAAGGIEVTRLLLLSRGVQKNGLGNDRDLVGRYFLEHPHLRAGFMVLTVPTGPLTLFQEHTHDQFLGHESIGILCASNEFLRRERLLNVSIQLYPAPRQPGEGGGGPRRPGSRPGQPLHRRQRGGQRPRPDLHGIASEGGHRHGPDGGPGGVRRHRGTGRTPSVSPPSSARTMRNAAPSSSSAGFSR